MPKILLPVPYFSQRDSVTNQALRMCFSSSCAMLVATLRPGFFKGKGQPDDQYLVNYVQPRGDTTRSDVQIAALKACGVKASFRQDLNWADLDAKLAKGIPVPIGILHHGLVSKPSGGGHWLLIIGRTEDGSGYIVHDPYGELDLVNGRYISTNGKQLIYSKKNLGPRWRVNGTGGWGILASKQP